MKKFKLAVAAIIVILLAVIIFQNRETVSTRLLFATVKMSRAALIFLSATGGFILGLVGRFTYFRKK
ncbi:LapA family protein [Candidatus Bipolaricaulota bacterium]|nr:LapA family protein [Candidatus Bipolaricaulota bacterium]